MAFESPDRCAGGAGCKEQGCCIDLLYCAWIKRGNPPLDVLEAGVIQQKGALVVKFGGNRLKGLQTTKVARIGSLVVGCSMHGVLADTPLGVDV